MPEDLLGHNSDNHLRRYVERIERLEEEIAGLNADKREVYSEARAAGLDKKVLRQVVMRRRRDRSDIAEEDDLRDRYEHALEL